jgi:poly(rC)-binding protein 2/3/4
MATKRAFDDAIAVTDPNAAKKLKTEDELLEIRGLVTEKEASVVIGKGGSNVKALRSASGAFISLLNTEHKTPERVLTVKGPEAAVVSAFNGIVDLLNREVWEAKKAPTAANADEKANYTVKVLVHKFVCGSLIGRGGAIVKQINTDSGARLHISTECLNTSTEKCVDVIGQPENIKAALASVIHQLECNRIDKTRSHSNYVPLPNITSDQLAKTGGKPPAYAAPPGYPAPYDPYNGYAPSPYAPPPSPYDPYAAQRPPYMAPPQDPYRAQVGGPAPVSSGAQLSQKIAIPTPCTGGLIGKGGSIIKNIKQQSGTFISIADPLPTAPHERVVTVTGSEQGIALAVQLIRQRVEAAALGQ